MYVRYYNYTYKRSGTLWEGRFKSSLVQSEDYLLELYRYIELNPVRADMIKEPSNYSWSSYAINALGKESALHTPHQEYLSLGKTPGQRQKRYRALFKTHIDTELFGTISERVNKGLALGNERFTKEIERLTSKRVTARKKGRPNEGKNRWW